MQKLPSPFVLIKKSIDTFFVKENLILFLKVYAPLATLSALSGVFIYIPSLTTFFESLAGRIFTNTFNVLFILITVFVNLAGVIVISKIVNGEKISFKSAFKIALKKFWKFLLLSILIYLLYILGLILLVVPLTIFSTWFAFSRFIMVEKNSSIKNSFRESKNLVKGIFWKVLVRNIVFGLFYIVSEMLLAVVPYGTGTIIVGLLGGLYVLPTYLLYKDICQNRELSLT